MPDRADRFVGRVEELRRLTAAGQQARAGHGRVVLVSGPAGIGKTRFCEEAAGQARASGLTVAWGRCWADGGAPALWPWQPVLTELCGPAAAGLLDHDTGLGTVDPERFSRFAAVVDRLADCPRSPVCLVLDDLHAAEPGAVLLTRFVARMRHRLPMLMVITVRETPGDERTRQIVEQLQPEGSLISLGRLELDDTRAVLAARGAPDADPALVRAVHRVTGGNPLYLQRLLALGGPDLARGLAGGVRNVVDESVRRVPAETSRLLSVGAMLGPVPSVAETAAVAAVPVAAVLAAVDRGAADGLAGRVGGDAFEFGHELVRAALVETLGPAERLDLHARAAAVLRSGGAGASHERLARRAHHAGGAAPRSAADARDAVAACRAAGASMLARFDYERAAELLATAARVHEHGLLGPAPAALLAEWARAVLSCGRLAESRVLFDRAAEAVPAGAEPVLAAEVALGLGGVWVNEHRDRGDRERVLARQRAALAALGPDQPVLRSRLRVRLAAEMVYSGGPLADVFAALAESRELGAAGALAEALSLSHHALLQPGWTTERLALADELVTVASSAGDGVLVLMGLCWRVVDLFHLGDPRAERALADLRARADALNFRSILYVVSVLEVMLQLRSGRLAAGEAAAAACYRQGVAVGDADAFAYYAAHLLAIRWLQGRGAELVDLAAEVADSPTLVQAEFTFQATVARLAVEAGQLDRARRALDRLTGAGLAGLPQSSTWLAGMLGIVEAAVGLGDAAVAAEAYRLLLPFADLPIMPSLAVVCFGSVHRPLGLAALATGDVDTAVEHLDRAVEVNTRLGNRPMTACCRAELALALQRRGHRTDQERARGLLARAVAEAESMGMAARAQRWRAAAAAPAGPHPRSGPGLVITREARHWAVALNGRRVVVGDLAGMRYLARLVARPGVPVSALELAGDPAGVPEPARQPVLDGAARAAYTARARDLLAELAEARENTDAARVERLEAEVDALADQLDRGTGLGGRPRTFTGPAERARTAVRKAIKRAVDTVAAADPVIAAELAATVSTGYSCCYTPRPPAATTIVSRRASAGYR